MQIIILNSRSHFFAQQIIIHKRLSCFAGELHHHTGRRIRIHISILAGNIVRLDIDNLQKHIPCLCFPGNASLIPISNIFLSYILAAAVHKFHFYSILYIFHRHLRRTFKRNAVRYLADQLHIFSHLSMQHSFSNSRSYLFLVETNDTSVSFDYCLNHVLLD